MVWQCSDYCDLFHHCSTVDVTDHSYLVITTVFGKVSLLKRGITKRIRPCIQHSLTVVTASVIRTMIYLNSSIFSFCLKASPIFRLLAALIVMCVDRLKVNNLQQLEYIFVEVASLW